MRVNIYAEEITDRVEIITKTTDEGEFTGVRFYLELPVTIRGGIATDHTGKQTDLTTHVKGPFVHRPGDDDSSAVTFWGKHDLRKILVAGIEALDNYIEQIKSANRIKEIIEAKPEPEVYQEVTGG